MTNHISIHGNIGQPPELKYTNSQLEVAEFTVADNYGKDDKKKTTWHNVVVFGKLALNIASTFTKGDSVIISGRLEQEEYTKKDGSKGKSIRVIADEVGYSLRWKAVVPDQTEQVLRQVADKFPGASVVTDEEPF
ncbi:Ssb Single-stranded DNA-binding protein [uncultured Caudovirales phage]|jgi:single-strand DNA-binding protein|uniref:Ssb Single-stranded DNA-binding protein n=1 Tax=uncultured Caudovirales phage TaxID=2100421 RepID=A0A6J5NC75_9CAUD|nr:Ssb Single-stranded DNA-binding protein [uncultured Caudovirales phage]